MTRFVVISTTIRGVVNPPEALDDANQWRALSALRQAESVNVRAEWEMEQDDAAVVWAKACGLRAPKKRVRRNARAAEWWARQKKAGV